MKILVFQVVFIFIAVHEVKAACSIEKDLFNGSIYLKSVCIIKTVYNYGTAWQKCADIGMNMFIINDEAVEAQFYDTIMNLVAKDYPRGAVWINGKRKSFALDFEIFDADGISIGPLYSGVDFYSKYADGNCLKFSGAYGPYQALPGSCSETNWATCEYSQKTEVPPVLDTTKCTYTRDLRSGSTYLKSVCIINTAYTYEEATRACSSLKMNLFMLSNKITEKSLQMAIGDLLKSWAGKNMWINGIRDFETNQWNTLNPDRTVSGQISKDIEWVNKGAVHGKYTGECLSFSGQYGPYQALGADCNTKPGYIMCEYII